MVTARSMALKWKTPPCDETGHLSIFMCSCFVDRKEAPPSSCQVDRWGHGGGGGGGGGGNGERTIHALFYVLQYSLDLYYVAMICIL